MSNEGPAQCSAACGIQLLSIEHLVECRPTEAARHQNNIPELTEFLNQSVGQDETTIKQILLQFMKDVSIDNLS